MSDQRDSRKDGSSAVWASTAAGSIMATAPASAILDHRAIAFLPNRVRTGVPRTVPGNPRRRMRRVQSSGSLSFSRLALARSVAASKRSSKLFILRFGSW